MTQNGKKPSDAKNGATAKPAADGADHGAPEVEVEIVEDSDIPPQREPGEAPTMEASGGPHSAALNSPPPKTALTPGVVLFLAFVIISALAVSVWRFQSGREAAPQSSPSAAGVDTDANAGDEAQEALDAPGAEPTDIANLAPAPGESEAPEADRGGDDDGAYLPPLPGASPPSRPVDATEVDEGVSTADNLQDRETPAGDAIEAFDIAEAPEPGVAPAQEPGDLFAAEPSAQSAAAPQGGADALDNSASSAVDGVAGVPPSRTDPARIDNNVEALKQAFRAETDALRRDFQDALNQRDQRASAAISDLRARLDKIQSGNGLPSGRDAAAAIALSGLARTAGQGAPFEGELEILTRLAPDSSALERLRSLAGEGAPTLSALKESFAPAAVDALAAAGRERAGGLMGQFLARLASLVSVRPANPKAGDKPRAIISRAEDRLDHGDLAAALAALEALSGPPRGAMAGWVGRAERRARLTRSIEELNAYFISQLQD